MNVVATHKSRENL